MRDRPERYLAGPDPARRLAVCSLSIERNWPLGLLLGMALLLWEGKSVKPVGRIKRLPIAFGRLGSSLSGQEALLILKLKFSDL